MKLKLFQEDYAVCKLNESYSSPICIDTNSFYYITEIKNELSVVCKNENIPKDVSIDKEWRLLEILEPLNLYLVGVVSKVNKVLRDAKVNMYEISTCENNYILVKSQDIKNACNALRYNGYEIV
ncbi:MAG: ACT domain-containing protein [Peptostreptococcaceae bacterium]